jgi:hypothetical protein
MKRLFTFLICTFLALGLMAVNTVTTGTLMLVSGTTYKIATANYYKMNLLLTYVIGDSVSVTIQAGYRYTDTGIPATTTFVASLVDGSTNIATDDAIVLNAAASRQIPLNTSKAADWLYLTFTFGATGATPGTLRADVLIDYNQ